MNTKLNEIATQTIAEYNECGLSYQIIETSIEATPEVQATLNDVIGHLSGGIWRDSYRMEKVWKNVDFIYLENKLVVLYKTHNETAIHKKSAFNNKDAKYVLNYFATKIKQIVLTEVEKLEWNRKNETELETISSEDLNITVKDVYKVYDLLKAETK